VSAVSSEQPILIAASLSAPCLLRGVRFARPAPGLAMAAV